MALLSHLADVCLTIRICQSGLQDVSAILHPHHQCSRIPLALHACQNLVLSVFLLNFAQCNIYVVVCHCGLSVHLHDGQSCWISSHVISRHSHVLFCEALYAVYNCFVKYIYCKYFSLLICGLPFYFNVSIKENFLIWWNTICFIYLFYIS